MNWPLDTVSPASPRRKRAIGIVWLEAEQDRCYTSVVVIAQLAYWVRTKDGRQRLQLQAWLRRFADAFYDRIHELPTAP